MIHSGMNAYLTLHMAQCLLRADDPRFFQLVMDTAAVASPRGNGRKPSIRIPWAVAWGRPACLGRGGMGADAAEHVPSGRGSRAGDRLGIPEEWLRAGKPMSFGPGPTGLRTHKRPPSVPDGKRASVLERRVALPAPCIVVKIAGRKA